jgi:hypothetical protein
MTAATDRPTAALVALQATVYCLRKRGAVLFALLDLADRGGGAVPPLLISRLDQLTRDVRTASAMLLDVTDPGGLLHDGATVGVRRVETYRARPAGDPRERRA